jgi:hypothetical protein
VDHGVDDRRVIDRADEIDDALPPSGSAAAEVLEGMLEHLLTHADHRREPPLWVRARRYSCEPGWT